MESSVVELSIVEKLIVELSMGELSTLDETMLEHCFTVELSMDELSVIDELTEFMKTYYGAKGLAWLKCKDGKLDGGISKFFPENIQYLYLDQGIK